MDENIIVLTLMILGHLIADYPLQGWLAQAKSKLYWAGHPKQNQKDCIAALICHGTMWGIIIFLPIIHFSWQIGLWWLLLPWNIITHCVIDHLKANLKTINLWQDQLLHLCQIVITWLCWVLYIW